MACINTRTRLKNRMIGDSSLFSLLWGEREIPHTRDYWYFLCSCVACKNSPIPFLLWQFNASMQVLDRNFQLMLKKGTTTLPRLFFGREDLARQLPSQPAPCLPLETCRSIITLWGEVCKMMMHSGSESGNFNSYQTLGQNKSPGH